MLPAAEWTRRDDLAALVAALGADNLRWVGGAVRDTLLGHAVKDIDAATTLHPPAVIAALAKAGICSVPTGIDHGTVTALCAGGPVEITTLRRDVATDGRRATVSFASDWREDAARRDFTINALYADPVTLQITDYFGGLDDLAARRVRFIGDARTRIREDHLRILRYYRFQARFGSVLDIEGEEACAELAPMLKGLSRERVGSELLALLALPDPLDTVARMAGNGVLAQVLPEARMDELGALIGFERAEGAEPDAVRRLAALLPPDARVADNVAARLRLSGAQKKRLMRLAGRLAISGDPFALAYRETPAIACDLLLLNGRSVALLAGWDPPLFPLKGGEIVARGVAAGPEVARILREVEERWVAEGFPPRDRVLAMLEGELGGQSSSPGA